MRNVTIYDRFDEDNVYVAGVSDVYDDVEEFISALKEGDTIYSKRNLKGDDTYYYCGDLPTYEYTTDEVLKEDIIETRIVPTADARIEKYGYKRNAEAIREVAKDVNTELAVYRGEGSKPFFYYKGDPDNLAWWLSM